MATTKNAVTVRMYNVGLGDSFLIRYPDAEGVERRILIDCGVHSIGPGPYKMDDVVKNIIDDVTDDGLARIDVVVASHRHRDHVLGFESERWADVEVGEVWMPWTEHPTDPEARKIRETQAKKATALARALTAMGDVPLQLRQMVDNSLTNAKAMATLHEGFAGRPKRRFLPSKSREQRTFETDVLPGARVHVMGPSRDPEVIRDMDPPKGGAYEMRMAAAGIGASTVPSLFSPGFVIDASQHASYLALFKQRPIDLKRVSEMAAMDPFAVAVAMDKAVNGTSLLLQFEIGRAHLTFPGDAQWGTWQNALADAEWRDLLAHTDFLKVGHHGSHNATPKAFVEEVLRKDRFTGMVCTRETKVFKRIPLTSLLTALDTRSGKRIARSDLSTTPKGFNRDGDRHTDTTIAM